MTKRALAREESLERQTGRERPAQRRHVRRCVSDDGRTKMLAKRVIPCMDVKDGRVVKGVNFVNLRDAGDPIEKKIHAIATKVYHADGADFTPEARRQMEELTSLGFGGLPICMAKTQYSFSDDPAKLGAPSGFRITVRALKVAAGAGFVVALTGDIMTMPGLPKVPAAEKIDIDEDGKITGLF